jgi:hypothetical protein
LSGVQAIATSGLGVHPHCSLLTEIGIFGGFTGAAQMRKSNLFRPVSQAEAGEIIPGGKGIS